MNKVLTQKSVEQHSPIHNTHFVHGFLATAAYLIVADIHTLQTLRYHTPDTKMNWATGCFSFYSTNH